MRKGKQAATTSAFSKRVLSVVSMPGSHAIHGPNSDFVLRAGAAAHHMRHLARSMG